MNTIQAQWTDLHKQEKAARTAGRWGEVKRIQSQITALKPQLANEVTGKATPKATIASSTTEPLAFNFYLYPASQRAAVLVDRVFNKWLTDGHTFYRPLPANVLRDYRKILEVVTVNLLRAIAEGRSTAGVRVRREERMFRQRSRYRPEVFDKKTLTVFDDVHGMKLAQQIKGEAWHKNPFDRSQIIDKDYQQTRLVPASLLFTLLEELFGQAPTLEDFAEITEGQEIVILKRDESSALVEYQDDATTVKYRAQMRLVNDMLANAGDLIVPEAAKALKIDQRERFLVRRFTYGSLTSGGRLWGGFWMGLKKEQRPHVLRINGERTAEVDYQSLIARLAYAHLNSDADAGSIKVPAGDLYSIPGLSPESRAGVKKLFGALLFDKTKNRDRFPKGSVDLFSIEDQRKGFRYVLDAIKAHHPAIAPLFGTGIGHYLQFLESKLLVNVILRLASKGITALPIHDCLVVEEVKAEKAKAIMELTGIEVLGCAFPAVIKGPAMDRQPS